MDAATKQNIGLRLRAKREQAGYTREQFGELCSLSPRFIANIELGDSTFSLDSLMIVCGVLACSSDDLLFGNNAGEETWDETVSKIKQLDPKYKAAVDKVIQGLLETIVKAQQ